MRERDVHNLIEQQHPEIKQRMWEKISAQLDLTPTEQQPKKAVRKKRWSWAAIAMAAVCVVTLSIVLPITLQGDKPDGNFDVPAAPNPVRYCDESQYTTADLGQTLQEYSDEHGGKLLYVDWYDVAEELSTRYGHITDDSSDIVFFEELIFNGDTGEELTLSITDNKTQVDRFDGYFVKYSEIEVKNVIVKIQVSSAASKATFEYENHIYYLQLQYGGGQERMVEIIEGMLK